MVKADRRFFADNLAIQTEEAAAKEELGQIYKITKLVCGKHCHRLYHPIRDRNGKLLTTERKPKQRWTEHSREILNWPPPTQEGSISPAALDLNISFDPPSTFKIILTTKYLKNNKAPGYDNLNAEIFKADPILAANIFQPLLQKKYGERNKYLISGQRNDF